MTMDALSSTFAAELDVRPCAIERVVMWADGPVRQRIFLGDDVYPAKLVTSARAVVFRGAKVVVVRDRSGARHIQPGGHLEPGETAEEALRRELLEETGWRVGPLTDLGFSFVEPVETPDGDGGRGWSGSIHRLFVAEGVSYHRAARDMTQIEVGSSLVPLRRAHRELSADQLPLLRAAMRARLTASVAQ